MDHETDSGDELYIHEFLHELCVKLEPLDIVVKPEVVRLLSRVTQASAPLRGQGYNKVGAYLFLYYISLYMPSFGLLVFSYLSLIIDISFKLKNVLIM